MSTAGRESARQGSFTLPRHIPLEDQQAGQWREGKGAYALALALGLAVFAYFLLNRSTRPSASTIFWVPVKNG
jgi:hypothetical protein